MESSVWEWVSTCKTLEHTSGGHQQNQQITTLQRGMVLLCLVIEGPKRQETIFAAIDLIWDSCFSYSSPVEGGGLGNMDGLSNTFQQDWTTHRIVWRTSWVFILKLITFICVKWWILVWTSPWFLHPNLLLVLAWWLSTSDDHPLVHYKTIALMVLAALLAPWPTQPSCCQGRDAELTSRDP